MKISIKFDTVRSGWSIIYIHSDQQVIIKNAFLSLRINFDFENSADHDEMPPYVAFHLGLHCKP